MAIIRHSLSLLMLLSICISIVALFSSYISISNKSHQTRRHLIPPGRKYFAPELRTASRGPIVRRANNTKQHTIKYAGGSSQTTEWQPRLLRGTTWKQSSGDIFIGILTDPDTIRTLGVAALNSWVQTVASYPQMSVYFFVGACDAKLHSFQGNVICLDTPDVYPPQRKVFLMWRFLYLNLRSSFKLFMKVDCDSYVNVAKLSQFVARQLANSDPDHSVPLYYGSPAAGRTEERASLGLHGMKYCAGLGYVVNKPVLQALSNNALTCAGSTVSNHSDTEIWRCIHRMHPTVECTRSNAFPFIQLYYQQQGHHVFPMKRLNNGQMNLIFPSAPKQLHFDAVVLHPLKTPDAFYRFHHQTLSYLRPIQPAIRKLDSSELAVSLAEKDLQSTCVHNPVRQLQKNKFVLDECDPPAPFEVPTAPTSAFVLSFAENSAEAFEETESVLGENGIVAKRIKVASSTSSQERNMAILQAFVQIIELAEQSRLTRVFILEEKVMFRCSFKQHLYKLLQSRRCSDHLFTEHSGGVLLLGSDIPTPDDFDLIEADRSRAYNQGTHDMKNAICYNTPTKIRTGFAGLYHRATFETIRSYISTLSHSDRDVSVNDLLLHLVDNGFIVRAATPNLILRESQLAAATSPSQEHETFMDPRQPAVNLRWTEGFFCRRDNFIQEPRR